MLCMMRVVVTALLVFLAVVLTLELERAKSFLPTSKSVVSSKESSSLGENKEQFLIDLSEIEDDAVAYNLNLIRPRPRNLNLVFIGDSVTRYQYLSLAYFLRWGRWFDGHQKINHLVHAHSFHHSYHPDKDWNEFFLQSNRLLWPSETCDCQRSRNGAIERRYFVEASHNNTLVYINLSGNETNNPFGGFAGRLKAADIFTNFTPGLPLGLVYNAIFDHVVWEYPTWGQVISEHVGRLNPRPTIAILNAGLHPHNFHLVATQQHLFNALQATGIRGIWKTTTVPRSQLAARSSNNHNHSSVDTTDAQLCALLECFNISWTRQLRPELYFDDLHFWEPTYRVMNEDLLEQLGVLPPGYERMNKKSLLLTEENV